MACRTGCATKDHKTYGECLKAARIKTDASGAMQNRTRTFRELDAYKAARDAGIQPAGTTQGAIDAANAMSDRYGAAFNAEDGTVGGKPPAIIEMGG